MKKYRYIVVIAGLVCLTACGKEAANKSEYVPASETNASTEAETEMEIVTETEMATETEIDFSADYSEKIKSEVDEVVANASSLQEELEGIENLVQTYTPMAQEAQTQMEMNLSSGWFFEIWDAELNALWDRFSELADAQTKETLLEEQRNWIGMKDEVLRISIGDREENGSMYPLLCNTFLEEQTKSRAYVIAKELAKIKKEDFVMPNKSKTYGLFVDNQGTDCVYGYLLTRQDWEGKNEARISIYRQGELTGTFEDKGNGELHFTSEDESIKGIIYIKEWESACFKVTEVTGEKGFEAGEEFDFPFAF